MLHMPIMPCILLILFLHATFSMAERGFWMLFLNLSHSLLITHHPPPKAHIILVKGIREGFSFFCIPHTKGGQALGGEGANPWAHLPLLPWLVVDEGPDQGGGEATPLALHLPLDVLHLGCGHGLGLGGGGASAWAHLLPQVGLFGKQAGGAGEGRGGSDWKRRGEAPTLTLGFFGGFPSPPFLGFL